MKQIIVLLSFLSVVGCGLQKIDTNKGASDSDISNPLNLVGRVSDPQGNLKSKVLIVEVNGVDEAPEKEKQDLKNTEFQMKISKHGLVIKDIINQSENFRGEVVEGFVLSSRFWSDVDHRIKKEKIRYVNLSFAFLKIPFGLSVKHLPTDKNKMTPHEIHKKSSSLIKKLIKGNPETLFIVAAGNGIHGLLPKGVPIDRSFQMIPASLYGVDNVFVVGSLKTKKLEEKNLPMYKISTFSNFGIKDVDVLSAGEGFDSGKVGGTSFAAPYTFVVLDKAYSILDKLSQEEIQSLLIKTVYVSDRAHLLEMTYEEQFNIINGKRSNRDKFFLAKPSYLPVRSGGILYPERIKSVAHFYESGNTLDESIDMAFIEEGLSEDEITEIKAVWKQRGI